MYGGQKSYQILAYSILVQQTLLFRRAKARFEVNLI